MGVWAQPMSGRKRKIHRTFSLSPEVIAYLKSFKATIKAGSMTAALEAIIREQKRLREEVELSASVSAFYDSLLPQERREESSWAEFAESEASEAQL